MHLYSQAYRFSKFMCCVLSNNLDVTLLMQAHWGISCTCRVGIKGKVNVPWVGKRVREKVHGVNVSCTCGKGCLRQCGATMSRLMHSLVLSPSSNLLRTVEVVADSPSERALKLRCTGKIKDRSKASNITGSIQPRWVICAAYGSAI